MIALSTISSVLTTDSLPVTAAFRSGAVMGFLLSGIGLLVLFITIRIFKAVSSLSLCLILASCGARECP